MGRYCQGFENFSHLQELAKWQIYWQNFAILLQRKAALTIGRLSYWESGPCQANGGRVRHGQQGYAARLCESFTGIALRGSEIAMRPEVALRKPVEVV